MLWGNPVYFMLTGGQIHDLAAAVNILSGVQIPGRDILPAIACALQSDDITQILIHYECELYCRPQHSRPRAQHFRFQSKHFHFL